MNKTFFTSDLHFGHDREFLWGVRGFNNIQEHDKTIIKNFNQVMDWDDKLYILGDCFLKDNEHGIRCLKQLPGTKYIIWGNHDTDSRKGLIAVLPSIKILGYASIVKLEGLHFYLSHYPTITSNLDENKSLKSRVINLYGHTHQKTNFYDGRPCNYHVGLDSHNCFPVEITDIIKEIKQEVKDCFDMI